MTIYPVERLPEAWVEEARAEGAYVDPSLKSPWRLFSAFDGDDAAGFIGVLLVGKTRGHIRGWFVFPAHRGDGIGGLLLSHAVDWCRVNGYHQIHISTAHNVGWLGFVSTDVVTARGETQYVLELVA